MNTYALFSYEDGVVAKITYPKPPRGLGRTVDGKIIRPKLVTFVFTSIPTTLVEQKRVWTWIEDCNRAIQIAPLGD